MILNLPTGWLLMALAAIAILAFILGLVVDALMKDDGFGPIGNALVIGAGYFTGVFMANAWDIWLGDMKLMTAAGLTGALIALATLSLVKAALNRIF